MDPAFLALSKLRRRRFDECIDICTGLLEKNPLDQAMWYMKTKALTESTFIDDTEMEEEGVAEVLMDENAIASVPRPGTSIQRPGTGTNGQNTQGVRPATGTRPMSGFARPGTSSRLGTSTNSLEGAFQGSRPNTSRPVTNSGRFVRLGTASLLSDPGGPFINVERLNLKKYAARMPLAKILFEYLLYHETNPMKALELASLCTQETDFKDWWWKSQLGKCYYRLGMLREAEKQLLSSLKIQEMVNTYLWLCKVYIKMDQPNTALEHYNKALERFPGELSILIGIARIYEAVNDWNKSITQYKRVLHLDSSNVEAIACLASNQFYSDQPELALRYYRRLLQMGVANTEVWNNVGLCCFFAQQYDMTLSCFERALSLAEDDNMGDVWFNIGQLSIGIGDVSLAYQAFKITVTQDPKHAEAWNNLGVLEMRKKNFEQARSNFRTAAQIQPMMVDPLYNEALLAFRVGDFQESFKLIGKALAVHPEHEDSKALSQQLNTYFSQS